MNARHEKIRKALAEISDRNGGQLSADQVVKAARNPKHSLHDEFEWSDRKAAEIQRLDRARDLISLVTVTVQYAPIKICSPEYVRNPRMPQNQQGHISLTRNQIALNEAKAIVIAEFDRIEGCVDRARGVAQLLAKKFPDIPDILEDMLDRVMSAKLELST